MSDDELRRERRSRIWRSLLAILGLVALFALIRRAGAENVWDTLAGVRPGWLAVWLFVEGVIFVGFALRWRMLLRSLGAEVPLPRLIGVRVAGLAVGTLTPGAKLGGEPLRAYLIARDGVPSGPAIASVAVDRSLELVANLVFAVAYCALFALRDQETASRVLIVVVVSGIAFVVATGLLVRRLKRGGSIVPARMRSVLDRLGASEDAIERTDEALRELLFARPRMLAGALGASLLLNAIILTEYGVLFIAFGIWPTLPDLAGALLGVGLAHALPIPASLGALEGAQAVVFGLADDDPKLAIVAATAARVRDIGWTVPGVIYLAVTALRRRASGRNDA
ncbi:MAG: lysylphosphatidylglycerol synthase transmembrane domain-containing protein [Candidatus Binatia bacterium]|nr:lysylphosphatidylglycerol synthase transmembrane domain-containing protein [Candidatus Binatia bacterium]